jgi:hypothetical protein
MEGWPPSEADLPEELRRCGLPPLVEKVVKAGT